MIWKQLIQKGASRLGQVINKYRQQHAAKQKQPSEPKAKQEKESENLATQKQTEIEAKKEQAQSQALEIKEDLQKQGIGQQGQDVPGHDGSIQNGYNNNSNSGSYNPDTDPTSPARGRSLGQEL